MGRNKIPVQYIEKRKDRSVTFCKRKVGLLKKACELTKLCGVEVSLLFTDMTGNIHFFTNNNDFKFSINEHIKLHSEKKLYKYGPSQYPFTGVAENVKKIRVEDDNERNDILNNKDEVDEGIFFSDIGESNKIVQLEIDPVKNQGKFNLEMFTKDSNPGQ